MNPTVLGAIITAFVAINTALIGGIVSYQQSQFEREKFRLQAILDAIKTGDEAQARRNLRFLVEAGLLRDDDNRLRAYLDSSALGTGRVLPKPN